jgi:subtilisin
MSAAEIRDAVVAVERRGATVMRFFDALGIVEVLVDPSAATDLWLDPHVDFVEPVATDYRVETDVRSWSASSRGSVMLLTELVPSNIDSIRAPLAWPYSTGSGARLLIVDSGHDWPHYDLPVVVQVHCHGTYGGCTDGPPHFHGTSVSGVALARQNGFGIIGVAPGVSVHDVYYWGVCANICANNGTCDAGELVNALNWSVNWLGSRGVINVSIAGSCGIAKAIAVAAAYNAGHVLVAPTGNTGTYTEKCIAWYSQVIAVAGISPDRTFAAPAPVPLCSPHQGSSWGNHVEVVAPYWAYTTGPANSHWDMCGTSLASPAVAGVALLVRARYPGWSNSQVRARIQLTAEPLGPPGWDDHFGYGLVRAHLAVAFDPPQLIPSVVANKAKLNWDPVPFAVQYEVWKSITPTACPEWELWTTTAGTTFTAFSPSVVAYHGPSPPSGGQAALNLFVVGVTADGTKTQASGASFLTVSSNPPC